MGTRYNVSIAAPSEPFDGNRLQAAIESELDRVDRAMSTYRDDSELSRFNRRASTEPFPLSAAMFTVFAAAQAVSEASGGAFDITVGPLVEAWGFGPLETDGRRPDSKTIALLRERTGWENLVLDPDRQTVRKTLPQIECDLSAIAKGYAVDRVSETLLSFGCGNHMVEIGGEVRVRGRNGEAKPWRIGVEKPGDARAVYRVLPLSGNGMATSGDYRNFRELEGKRYVHTIDPRNGLPIAHRTASVTVLDRSAMRADAFATAILVLGENTGFELAEREGLAALLLLRRADGGFDELASSAFNATISAVQP